MRPGHPLTTALGVPGHRPRNPTLPYPLAGLLARLSPHTKRLHPSWPLQCSHLDPSCARIPTITPWTVVLRPTVMLAKVLCPLPLTFMSSCALRCCPVVPPGSIHRSGLPQRGHGCRGHHTRMLGHAHSAVLCVCGGGVVPGAWEHLLLLLHDGSTNGGCQACKPAYEWTVL